MLDSLPLATIAAVAPAFRAYGYGHDLACSADGRLLAVTYSSYHSDRFDQDFLIVWDISRPDAPSRALELELQRSSGVRRGEVRVG
jgi:hypothetical protein